MLGDMLRKERERQQLSIRDIEQGTSIRAIYIEAIEKEDWAALPGDVYAKGFVRNYANFLKIDADACVGQYQEEVHASPAPPPNPEPVYQNPKAESIFPSGDDYRNRVENTHKSQNKLLLAAVALVLIGGAYFAFGAPDDSPEKANPKISQKQAAQKADAGKSEKQSAATATTSPPATAQPSTAQPAKGSSSPAPAAAAAAPTSNTGDIDLHAQFTDRCWMRVVADGQVVYEGTAQKGQAMSWKAKNQIVITAGNAGAVDITQNGKLLGNPGDYGSVVEKTYTKATLPQ